MYLCTIWHTGTHTFREGLKHLEGFHFRHVTDENALDIARNAKQLATTYRDPYRVAASWANRGEINRHQIWRQQWSNYKELLQLNPLIFYCDGPDEQHGYTFPTRHNVKRDRLNLHKALDEQDMTYYHKKVPKELIDYTFEQLNTPCLKHAHN